LNPAESSLLLKIAGMKPLGKQGLQILLVDDEPTVRRAIKLLLEHDGHEVQVADCGEAALALTEQRKFDLVITDFSMPGMKGDELIARIRQLQPDQPVIMATAFAEQYKVFGQPSGNVDTVLLKPFSLGDLREAIDQVVPRTETGQPAGLPPVIHLQSAENLNAPPEP
jgi:CheY-like chemotaxis protein